MKWFLEEISTERVDPNKRFEHRPGKPIPYIPPELKVPHNLVRSKPPKKRRKILGFDFSRLGRTLGLP